MSSRLCNIVWLMIFAAAAAGCTSAKQSNTARTGTEQLLISNAVDQSLNKVDFTAFGGQNVYMEDKYLDCVDKGYITGSIRHRLLRTGANLVAKAEEADVVIEPRSGAVGTDLTSSYLGVPEITLPGMLTLPEVKIISRDSQMGVAKLAILAYDAKTKQILGDGGVALSKSDDNNFYVLGMGPLQNGSLREEVNTSTSEYSGQPYFDLPRNIAFEAPRPKLQSPPQTELADEQASPDTNPRRATRTSAAPR